MCFSPKVTAATFAIEIVLAVWVWMSYRMSRLGQLTSGMLLLLGAYQLTEFMICVGDGQANQWWGRLGFVIITFLPIVAIHAASMVEEDLKIKNQKTLVITKLVPYGYALAIILSGFFLLSPTIISGAQCTPYYIIYQHSDFFFEFYSLYYAGSIALGFVYFMSLLDVVKGPKRQACLWLCAGYLSFVIPTFLVITIFPFMNIGFPSVLCGFAIFLSIILVAKVLPLYHQGRRLK